MYFDALYFQKPMKLPVIIYVAILILFASCSPQMYFPDRVNSPCLTEKGEVKAVVALQPHLNRDTSYKISSVSLGTAVDAAYAITDHFGVIASYRGVNNKHVIESTRENFFRGYPDRDTFVGGNFNGHRLDIGAGRFWKFAKKGMMEVYGGVGWGIINRNSQLFPMYSYDADYYRVFVQYGVGMYHKHRFRISGGARFVLQQYYQFSAANDYIRYNISNDQTYYKDLTKSPQLFTEPYANIEFGGDWLKLSAQFGAVFTTNGLPADMVGKLGLCGSLGLTFNYYPDLFKKQNDISYE